MERLLEKRGYAGCCFSERRIRAERALEGYPSLDQIYEELGRCWRIAGSTLEVWKQLELEVEDQVLVPRRKMAEISGMHWHKANRFFWYRICIFLGRCWRGFCKNGE